MWEAITIAVFALINVLLAYIDSKIIFRGGKILHGINGLVYCGLVAGVWFIFNNYWLCAALLVERLLFFNIALSLFRRLDWDYVSPERKSVIDKVAYFFFGYNGKLMYFAYSCIFITLTAISFM